MLTLCVASCAKDRLSNKACQQDADCGHPAGALRCEPQTGECFCRSDLACPGSQLCNAAGFCQDRAGCATNLDCADPSLFCDTPSGQCVPLGRCSSDLECALGQICDPGKSQCTAGCRRSGDCPGTSCRCGALACGCAGTTPAELAACAVGVCDATFCADGTFCRFGELCGVVPDAGSPHAQCYSDFDVDLRPYCARCTSGGGIDTCGSGANFCIIDTRLNSTYCGADCSQGQACPRGYGCRDIRVVYTRWACSATKACPPDLSLPCASDPDCKRGGSCIKEAGQTTGSCAGQCRLREGSDFGFCSCQVDYDCAPESCNQGECSITRRKCIPGDPNACTPPIHCVDFEGVGACVIGQNCTPADGLTCREVQ